MNLPTSELLDALLSDIKSFQATESGNEFADDVCVVGMDFPEGSA